MSLFSGPPPAPPPEPLPPPRADTGAQTDLAAGLAALPSSQQVVTAVAFGRTDPFAPLPALAPPAPPPATATAATARGGDVAVAPSRPAGSGPSTPGAPAVNPLEGLQLTGVIHSGGSAEALVSYRGQSGSVKPGDRGGKTPLLPPGLRLTAISFGGSSPTDSPSITLVGGGRRWKVPL